MISKPRGRSPLAIERRNPASSSMIRSFRVGESVRIHSSGCPAKLGRGCVQTFANNLSQPLRLVRFGQGEAVIARNEICSGQINIVTAGKNDFQLWFLRPQLISQLTSCQAVWHHHVRQSVSSRSMLPACSFQTDNASTPEAASKTV